MTNKRPRPILPNKVYSPYQPASPDTEPYLHPSEQYTPAPLQEQYNTPIASPYQQQRADADEIEREPLFETDLEKTSFIDSIKENAHTIAFAAGNLLLVAGEYRVYDFTYSNTGEVWKGVFAVFASFVPFLLWEIAVQHAKATGGMRAIAWIGMTLSFGLGALVGIADFITIGDQSPNAEGLLGIIAGGLSIHAVLFLAYFYSHPDIKAKRLVTQAIAKQHLANSSAEVAENLLTSARNRLELERRIADEYGYENLRRAIAEIEGRSYSRPKKTYNPRHNRERVMPVASQPAYQAQQPLAPLENKFVNDEQVRDWAGKIDPETLRKAGLGEEDAIAQIAKAYLEYQQPVGQSILQPVSTLISGNGNGNGHKPAPATGAANFQ